MTRSSAHARIGRSATTAIAWAALACVLGAAGLAEANTSRKSDRVGTVKTDAKAARSAARPPSAVPRAAARVDGPVIAVESTAADQAGFVHYFVVTGPDGQPINHVGVELPGNRIASSFPDDGVSIAPFFKQGAITTSAGNVYEVEHLYGLRPFADDASMRALQKSLDSRVQPWIDAKTPYCDELTPSRELCVSCLTFVMSVLYPEALPSDFKGVQKNLYTTDDLLMYIAGIAVDAPREARAKRIAAIKVPKSMREELVRISGEIDDPPTIAAPATAPAPNTRPATANLPKRVLTRRRS